MAENQRSHDRGPDSESMDAIVPAAGQGSRLRPLTDDRPKGLVEVGGRPLLGHVFDDVLSMGAERIVVVIGYEGEQIIDHFGDRYRDRPVRYVEQASLEGLAHAVGLARPIVDGPAVIELGDNVFAAPPTAVTERFRTSADAVTIGVERVPLERAGEHTVCVIDDDGGVQEIEEKPAEPASPFVLAGVLAADGRLLDATTEIDRSDRGEYELADAIKRLIKADLPVTAVSLDVERKNVNTPADRDAASALVERRPETRHS